MFCVHLGRNYLSATETKIYFQKEIQKNFSLFDWIKVNDLQVAPQGQCLKVNYNLVFITKTNVRIMGESVWLNSDCLMVRSGLGRSLVQVIIPYSTRWWFFVELLPVSILNSVVLCLLSRSGLQVLQCKANMNFYR